MLLLTTILIFTQVDQIEDEEFSANITNRFILLTAETDSLKSAAPKVDWCSQTPSGAKLASGSQVNAGTSFTSPNGKFVLLFQTNADLVLFENGMVLWSSSSAQPNGNGCTLRMQSDNNLVIYCGPPKWASGTNSNSYSGTCLVVQDDRNVVLYTNAGTPIWATNTQRLSYLKSIQVQYDQAPGNAIQERSGGNRDINYGFGGRYVYIYAVWTDNLAEAVTGIDFRAESSELSGYSDLAKDAGGAYRYLVPTRDNSALFPIYNVGLMRAYSSSTPVPFGHTGDINKGRGGDYLYLLFQKMTCLPDTAPCNAQSCATCCNGFFYSARYGNTICGLESSETCYREGTLCNVPGKSCSDCCAGAYSTTAISACKDP